MPSWTSDIYPDPAKRLNVNRAGGHWSVDYNAKQEWRKIGWVAGVMRRRPTITGKAVVQVTFGTNLPDKRRDPANFYPTTKAVVDGLTDAKFWPDDDSKHVAVLESVFTDTIADKHFQITVTWDQPPT